MPKRTHRPVEFTPEETAYELPAEINVKRLRPAGRGPEATRKLVERSKRMVGLDADVARDFASADEVNEALRELRQLRDALSGILSSAKVKKRKSA
jgi:hypothetical protein